MKKPFEPNFQTPQEDYCKEELNKLHSNGMRGPLYEEFRDQGKPDIIWEAEQLAKSYGIYLEFNRAHTGPEKQWMYMIRISNPGGGPISREQWLILDELAGKYTVNPGGHPSLRLTTRQNIQFHWVSKQGVMDIVKTLAEKGLTTLNGCGDNTRSIMACPLSGHSGVFDGNQWARRTADYFQLPVEPFIQIFAIDPQYLRKPEESFSYKPNLLNRKFKIAFSAVHRDPETGCLIAENCIEVRTHDLGVVPVISPDGTQISGFQIYIGGGQGERNGKPTMAALGQPLAVVQEDHLFRCMDAIVQVHQEWGDRQNRHWARLKYVVKKMGVDWFRQQLAERLDFDLGEPMPDLDPGPRHLHHGWTRMEENSLWAYGVFIENGRIIDNSPNGRLKTMVKDIMTQYPVQLLVTANQDIVFINIPEGSKTAFEDSLKSYGYGQRNGKAYSPLRLRSGACVGRDTCRLTYTDSEKYEPLLIDELETLGWGDMTESIGITGCERQCFRPATKTIGLVGSGLNRYQFKLMGDESGRFQGRPVISGDGEKMYLRSVSREQVPVVIDALFRHYQANGGDGEGLGAFHRRIGMDAVIEYLQGNPSTAPLMDKPFNTSCVI